MKKIIPILISLILCTATNRLSAQDITVFQKTKQLLEHKQFFKAQTFYASNKDRFSKIQQLKTEAILNLVFNKPEASNQKIDVLFNQYGKTLTDSVKYKLTDIKKQNDIRLFAYDKATKAILDILDKYRSFLDAEEIKDYENTLHLWRSLAGQPAQSIKKNGKTNIQIIRDKANLPNITVASGTVKENFIFDTGANLSTVTESTARKLGMKFMDGRSIKVGSIAGEKVEARVAICPELYIGNIEVRNVVFLVFPDSDLYFPQIDYQIHGILGFPVIEAMKEIQITKNDQMIVPETLSFETKSNLALDLFLLVLNMNGDPYIFDSGAQATFLYAEYYQKHRNFIEKKFTETILHFGGAGGMTNAKGFVISFDFTSFGKTVSIDSVGVFKDNLSDTHQHYYGNIGQDVVGEFDTMILNFDSMFLKFE